MEKNKKTSKKKSKVKVARRKPVPKIPLKTVARVTDGILWLDLTFGRREWLKRIDVSKFEFRSPYMCVAGQVFEEHFDGFMTMMENINAVGEDAAVRLGFEVDNDLETEKMNREYQYLQDYWAMVLKRLKKSK